MLSAVDDGRLSIERMVEKMCHAPAQLYNIDKRGFIEEGFYADLVLLNENPYTIHKKNILYKCAWSPLEKHTFNHSIDKVWVNGTLSYENGSIKELNPMRLTFDR
jgi:dihydroorotase